MNNKIPYATYFGNAAELCKKGEAVEFIQPWYTPISTTPNNTGMAIGGIGNTFTLTAKGATPNFSFIPGIFIDISQEDLEFNDFYASVMSPFTLDNLAIKDAGEMSEHLKFYPAVITAPEELSLLEKIKHAISNQSFYADNKQNFAKWNVEFTSKTKSLIAESENALETQLYVARDFFNGYLINTSTVARSLIGEREACVEAVASASIEYKALYPFAEYQYPKIEGVEISRKVVSPIVKDDKRLCSLPVHWNHFEVRNTGNEAKTVTLVQTLANLIGSTYRKGRDGIQDSACVLSQNPINQKHQPVALNGGERQFAGVSMASESRYGSDIEGEVIFGVDVDAKLIESNKVSVSTKSSIYTTKVQNQVWNALHTGRTNEWFDHGIYSGREGLAAIVTIQIDLEPGESVDFRFAQLMEHSQIGLKGLEGEKAYRQFYPQDKPAMAIMGDVQPEFANIEARIVEQQQNFLVKAQEQIADGDTAERFAAMAMNTLSFLAESTVWDVNDKFLVKECVDYPFFNSLDVYFYGSFSILYLLPELDGAVMKEFARAIMAEDATKRRYWEYEDKPNAELIDDKYEGVRAVTGAVIHDLGSPYDTQADAYSWHNVKEWKDLAPKYILMVYRHFQHSQDQAIVEACWPAIEESLKFLSALIEEGDTLPLTRGTDDTFDNLSSHGISIYCASLWSAGLKAASEMAKTLNKDAFSAELIQRSDAALATLEAGLWDEQNGYFHFFVTPVQAKHLTGETNSNLVEIGLELTGQPYEDKALINAYLNEVDSDSGLSKLEQRLAKKHQLLEVAPNVFTPEYQNLVEDSDNSFGDALLADSYLKLIGLEGLFSQDKIERTLDYIFDKNFLTNSPKLGVANMVLADGMPHEAFQAQDVWIGVQFSMATALKLAGKHEQAKTLINTVYDALYHQAKIPFAAPEGFNCSVAVATDDLEQQFTLDAQTAAKWLEALKASGALLADGRVNPEIATSTEAFAADVNLELDAEVLPKLHKWLLNTGLKYTAGRYFRPGMIFSYLY
ncbi:glucosylceramidase [Vibrio parahaemolyticus]|nr:glucosylceramidase [Vibrio parahaemolyticus]